MSRTKAPASGTRSLTEARRPLAATTACPLGWWLCGPRSGALRRGAGGEPRGGHLRAAPAAALGRPACRPAGPRGPLSPLPAARGPAASPLPVQRRSDLRPKPRRLEGPRTPWTEEHSCRPRARAVAIALSRDRAVLPAVSAARAPRAGTGLPGRRPESEARTAPWCPASRRSPRGAGPGLGPAGRV